MQSCGLGLKDIQSDTLDDVAQISFVMSLLQKLFDCLLLAQIPFFDDAWKEAGLKVETVNLTVDVNSITP